MSVCAGNAVRDLELLAPNFLPDVQIVIGRAPSPPEGAVHRGVLWVEAAGRLWLRVPGAASFLVEAGRQITIDPEPDSNPDAVTRFLHMTPFAALLYQRGILAFHSAAAAKAGEAIFLAGDSGAGKSTLLMELVRRGWIMLADELSALSINDAGEPQTWPVSSQVRLWQKTDRLDPSPPASDRHEGYWRVVPVAGPAPAQTWPLRAIYWLGVHNAGRIDEQELHGVERFHALGNLTYNSHVADAILDRSTYLRQATILAGSVPVRRLTRPRGQPTVEALADRIERALP